MKNLHWFIARHYLRAGRGGLLSLITWIALGGVTVGVGALIIVVAVMTGMQHEIRTKILASQAHLIVMEYTSSLRVGDFPTVLDSALQLDAIEGGSPYALSQVSVMRTGLGGRNYSQPAYLYGVDTDTTNRAPTEMERRIMSGEFNLERPESGLPPLLLGSVLADRMIVFPGDTLLIVASENMSLTALGFSPMVRQFEVTGTFTTGMYDYDFGNVYTEFRDAQELLGLDANEASGLGLATYDLELAPEVAELLAEHLGPEYSVTSWIDQNQQLFNALQLEKLAMALVVFLIVMVAALNIVGTLVMVVADRTREIGILKTMGMTRVGILRVFQLQGAWIGIVGTTVGASLGLVISWALERFQLIKISGDVYFIEYLPALIQITDVGMIVFASVVISFLATIYPSLQAANLVPVEAIRHE